MAAHPDLADEQAYVDHAYDCLDAARKRAFSLRRLSSIGPGGTHQARIESEAVEDTIRTRLAQLELGDEHALVFGRIDPVESPERYYIGRIAVADEHQDPVVVDWRAPIAEPFYRATGRQSMGLALRRHFASRARQLLDIEDEVFGPGGGPDGGLVGQRVLLAAIDAPRTGYLGDIVATIQAEQDEIIRAPLPGVLVVQGGPGTGKTVVALHRAAYLLYTHRFPLEDQGVLVVGPNRVFLRYVSRVLPSLGEAGVELAVLADLVPETIVEQREPLAAALVKGDLRMVEVLARAVRDRQRPLRRDLVVGFGREHLRVTVAASERIVRAARRRSHTHNAGRRIAEALLWTELAASSRQEGELEPEAVREQVRGLDEVRTALEWMWPVLTPADLLRDLFGSPALVRSASRGRLSTVEEGLLHRERGERGALRWTDADVALLAEAHDLLGPVGRAAPAGGAGPAPGGGPAGGGAAAAAAAAGLTLDDGQRSWGHIVVDEAQDLTPMQLRMLAKRSLGGSMTVVGDLAQATGPWAPPRWEDVLSHLPSRRTPRVVELSIGYRTPEPIMRLANRVLAAAAPGLAPSRPVRGTGDPPEIEAVDPVSLPARVAARAAAEAERVGEGNVAVIAPDSWIPALGAALEGVHLGPGSADTTLSGRVSLVPVRYAKGLELDSVIVVDPARIVAEEPQGLRSLYVALTRATRRLHVLHTEPLPEAMIDPAESGERVGGSSGSSEGAHP